MAVEKYSVYHFSLSRKAPKDGSALAVVDLLRDLAGHLEEIEGLTDENVSDIVITQENGLEGGFDMTATVYYSLDVGVLRGTAERARRDATAREETVEENWPARPPRLLE